MNTLRTCEQVWQQNAESPIYLIAAEPDWAHYDVERLPTPIRSWIEDHYPTVVIEQLSGLSFEKTYSADNKNPHDFLGYQLPRPIFSLGFSREQAAHFVRAWSTPPLHTPDAPNNFYFLTNDTSDLFHAEDEATFGVTIGSGGGLVWEVVEQQI